MVSQKRKNGEDNLYKPNKYQLVDLSKIRSFCDWHENTDTNYLTNAEIEEEQIQNETETEDNLTDAEIEKEQIENETETEDYLIDAEIEEEQIQNETGTEDYLYLFTEQIENETETEYYLTDAEIEEEQIQNEMETEEITFILETEGEPQSSDENEEILFSRQQMLVKYLKMSNYEVNNLYEYSSGSQEIDILDVSHESKVFKCRYNVLFKVVSENKGIQEYEIILNSHTQNNDSENELSIFIYRDHRMVFLWLNETVKYKNSVRLSPDNINVKDFVHRINYQVDVANDNVIKNIYPDYSHLSFIKLFCQYLDIDEKIFKVKMNMSRYDILTVYLEGSWLNDQAINKYFSLVKQRNNSEDKLNIHVFDTFFFTTFSTHGYNRIISYTKKIDIFSFKKLIIPVNIDSHWLAICIDVPLKNIYYYDSYAPCRENRVIRVLRTVTNFLCMEYSAKKGFDFNTDELNYIDGKSPEQNNNDDCGVFTCINGELFSRNKPPDNYNHTHINLYRQKIVYELLNQKLISN